MWPVRGMHAGFWYENPKVKGHCMICLSRHRGEVEVQLQPIHNQALEGGGWSAPCSNYFTLRKNLRPIV